MDPFLVAPRDVNFAILKAVEPFLRIHQPRDLRDSGAVDKFEGGKLNPQVLDGVINFVALKLSEVERKWDEQKTELSVRNLELIGLIEHFTEPTDQNLLPHIRETLSKPDEEQSGFTVQLGSGASDRGRTDGRVLVHDTGPLKREDLDDVWKSEISTQRCAIVEQFTVAENSEAIAQPAACSLAELRQNISNKHYEPICLLLMSKFNFTYAFIVPEGVIRASGSEVTDAAYTEFCESCRHQGRCTSLETLKNMYKIRIQHLRNLCGKPDMCYELRDYIVGDLYLVPEWYALPTTKTDAGLVSTGAKKFFEGLLRVVVGDIVLNWDYLDMLEAIVVRQVQALVQTRVGGLDYKQVLDQQSSLSRVSREALREQECVLVNNKKRKLQDKES